MDGRTEGTHYIIPKARMSFDCFGTCAELKPSLRRKATLVYLGVRLASALDVQVSSLASPGVMPLHKATPETQEGVHADIQTSLALLNSKDKRCC